MGTKRFSFTMVIDKVTAHNAGCWLDNNARGIHMPSAIINIAEAYGYNLSDILVDYLKETSDPEMAGADRDELIDDWEFAEEEVQDAELWMNEHVAPTGYYFETNPDWGDWGLYGATMGHSIHDIAGAGPFDREDLLDFLVDAEPGYSIVFEHTSIPLQEVLQDEDRCGLPEFLEVVYLDNVNRAVNLERIGKESPVVGRRADPRNNIDNYIQRIEVALRSNWISNQKHYPVRMGRGCLPVN